MEATQYKTPYERYLREEIEEERKHLDRLYDEFARTGPVNKQLVKKKIDETLQNIDLLGKELAKYGYGLSWLRELSRERDEKAERLEKVQEEAQAAPSVPARPGVGASRPAVGTPVGAPKPTVGTPVAAKPNVGTPVGAKPSVGTPVGTRPTVGTPVGKPHVAAPVQSTQEESSNTPARQASTSEVPPVHPSGRPRVGKPLKEEKSS